MSILGHSDNATNLNISTFIRGDDIYSNDFVGDKAIVTDIETDTIIERTTDHGVTIEGIHFENSQTETTTLKVGSTGIVIDDILDEDDMDSNSATSLVTQQSIKGYVDNTISAGVISGFAITDNSDGTVDIAQGNCWLRTSASDTGDLRRYVVSASAGITIPVNTEQYLYVNYNSGTPVIAITTSGSTIRDDENNSFELYEIVRNGTTDLHISEHFQYGGNTAKRLQRYLYSKFGSNRTSGLIISETGTRNLAVSAGKIWIKLNEISTIPVDTSGAPTFSIFYDDGSSGHTEVTAQSAWDNTQYDDDSGSLATLTTNRYGFHEVWVENDGDLVLVYGRVNATSLSIAENYPIITDLPDRLGDHGTYIGRIVFQKSAGTLSTILSAFTHQNTASPVTIHGDLAILDADDHTQYLLLAGRAGSDTDINVPTGQVINFDVNSTTIGNISSTGFQLNSGSIVTTIHDTDAMTEDSNTALSTQQSIKAFGEGLITTHNSAFSHSDIATNKSHITANGSSHSYINQDVSNTASPTFLGFTIDSQAITDIHDTDAMTEDSNTSLATQQSIKAYVDNSAVVDRTSTIIASITAGDSFGSNEFHGEDYPNHSLNFASLTKISLTPSGSATVTIDANSDGDAIIILNKTASADASKLVFAVNDSEKCRFHTGGVDTHLYLSGTSSTDFVKFDTVNHNVTLLSGTSVNEFSTDGTLAGNSDDAIPTEQAVKTYVDNIEITGYWDRSGTKISPSTADDTMVINTIEPDSGNQVTIRHTTSDILLNLDGAHDCDIHMSRGAVDKTCMLLLYQNSTYYWMHGMKDGGLDYVIARDNSLKNIIVVRESDNAVLMPEVYADTVTSSRDLEIQSDGKIGYVSSCLKSKTNISELGIPSWLNDVRCVTFNYKKKENVYESFDIVGPDGVTRNTPQKTGIKYLDEYETNIEVGCIAEEVVKLAPNLVFSDDDGEPLGIHYKKFTPYLIKMCQHLYKENALLKARVSILESHH